MNRQLTIGSKTNFGRRAPILPTLMAPSWRTWRLLTWGAIITSVLWANAVIAAPFIPKDDTQVLEHLRVQNNPVVRELRQLRKALAEDPDNLQLAIQLARQYREIGRAESDPRYYGYAQAALGPWWDQVEPPLEVLLLRSILRQAQHDFDGALTDLNYVLQARPNDAQAWLTQAVIHQVRGNYDWARSSCVPLLRLTNALVSTTCIANATSLNGGAQTSYNLLDKALQGSSLSSGQVKLWALTVLAEIASRLGHDLKAEQHFQQALSLGLRDTYLLGAYCDFLLDQDRPAEVNALLQNDSQPDGLLLRLALAEQRLGLPELEDHVESLRTRFTENRFRSDTRHLRLEARFTLHLLKDSTQALELARENWSIQREPWDARILLEAALQSGDRSAAQPIVDWLTSNNLEDVQLKKLTGKLS